VLPLVPTPSHEPPDVVVAATVKLIGAPALEIVRTWLGAPEPPAVVAKYSDVELTERPGGAVPNAILRMRPAL
jgi:hypothetical protein